MLFDRLHHASRDELAWRARATTRIHRDRLASALRPPAWDRRRLSEVLDASIPDASMRSAIDAHDWPSVHDALFAHLLDRSARFMLNPARAGELCSGVLRRWPHAAAEATAQADDILAG